MAKFRIIKESNEFGNTYVVQKRRFFFFWKDCRTGFGQRKEYRDLLSAKKECKSLRVMDRNGKVKTSKEVINE